MTLRCCARGRCPCWCRAGGFATRSSCAAPRSSCTSGATCAPRPQPQLRRKRRCTWRGRLTRRSTGGGLCRKRRSSCCKVPAGVWRRRGRGGYATVCPFLWLVSKTRKGAPKPLRGVRTRETQVVRVHWDLLDRAVPSLQLGFSGLRGARHGHGQLAVDAHHLPQGRSHRVRLLQGSHACGRVHL